MGDQVNQNLQQVAEHGKDIFQHIHTTRGKHVLPLAPLETLVAQHEERLRSPSPDPGSLEEYINNTHFVFQRSPPCYKPLSSLKKADITNLKWSTVHRGRFVVLRTSTHPRLLSTNLGQLETIVEDERGVGVTLRVFNVNVDVRASNAEKWLPMGSVIAILEPYCEPIPDMDDAKRKNNSTSSGIRVDHPSDIVSLEHLDKLYPKQWANDISTPTISGEQSCEVLKEEGNQAFKAKDYYVAIQRYTSALHPRNSTQLAQNAVLHTSLLLNLAQAQLLTQDFARAHVLASDALVHLNPVDSNDATQVNQMQSREKALFRSARASYALARYGECIRTLNTLLTTDLNTTNTNKFPEAESLLKKAQQRLVERDEGKYDWTRIVKVGKILDENLKEIGSVLEGEDADLADYVGPIELKVSTDTTSSTTSLVATRTIQPGELILSCTALSALPTSPPQSATPSFIFDASTGSITLRESPPVVRSLTSLIVRKSSGLANIGKPGSKLAGVLRGGEVYDKVRVGRDSGIATSDKREDAPVRIVEGRCVIDTNAIDSLLAIHTIPFHPIHPLASRSPISGSSLPPLLGLFPLPHIPHACLPNAVQSHLGPLLVLRACREIKKGERVTCARVHASLPIDERWEAVRAWDGRGRMGMPSQDSGEDGKGCSCEFCEAEIKEGPSTRQTRVDLMQQVKQLAERLPPSSLQSSSQPPSATSVAPPKSLIESTISTLNPLIASLSSTYTLPPSIHPRFALLEPLGYLSALHLSLPGKEHVESALRANLEFLAALGYEFEFTNSVPGTGDGDIVLTRQGHPHPLALKTLLQQASICWQVNRRRAAEGWRKCAVQGIEIIGGPEGEGAEVLFEMWESFSSAMKGLGWKV